MPFVRNVRLGSAALVIAVGVAACGSGTPPAPASPAPLPSAGASTAASGGPVQEGGTEQTQDGVTIVHDAVYTGAGQVRKTLDVYRPTRRGTVPGIVFVHGGGWYEGTKSEDADLLKKAALRGYALFSVDYPLASPGYPTEGKYVQTAISWVREHADRYGVDPARIGGWGLSAGGNLALWAGAVGTGSRTTGSRLLAVATWSAPIDLADGRDESGFGLGTVARYLGCDPQKENAACLRRAADASPVTFVDPTDPPAYLASSTRDGLVPIHQLDAMKAAMDRAGIPVRTQVLDGTRHAGEYGDEAYEPTMDFLASYLHPSA